MIHIVSEMTMAKEDNSKSEGLQWYMGSLILINALIGAGFLSFPYSIHAAGGFTAAISVQTCIMFLQWFAVASMVWCSLLKKTSFYQDTVREYLGAVGQYICALIILLFSLMLTTTYVIAIGQQMTQGIQIALDLLGVDIVVREGIVVAVVMAFIVFPFCVVDHIDKLKHVSACASASVLLVGGIVTFKYFDVDHSQVAIRTHPERWTDVFLAVPAYAIAYMMDLCSVAVSGRLQEKTVKSYMKASGAALIFVFTFFNVSAGFAYCTFGDNIRPNFMTNYRERSWPISVAQIFYSFKLCLEYPIYQFLAWTAFRTLVSKFSAEEEDSVLKKEEMQEPSKYLIPRVVTSVIWVVVTVFIGLFAGDINLVLPLVSVAALLFQFILPGLCLLRGASELEGEGYSRLKLRSMNFFGVFFVSFGVGLSGIVFGQYMQEHFVNKE